MPESIRISRKVSVAGVNLAWVRIPALEPLQNLSLVDTARFIAENIDLAWKSPKGSSVPGVFTQNDYVSGYLYATSYNPVPAGVAASGLITSGTAQYTNWRERTAAVSPSGFVVQNFTSQIQVLHPDPEQGDAAWRLRVQDGLVLRRYVMEKGDGSWLRNLFSPGDELLVSYTLPEATRLPTFTEGGTAFRDARVVDVSGARALLIDEHTLQLPDEDLVEVRSLTVNGEELITSAAYQLSTLNSPAVVPPVGPFTAWRPERGELTLSRTLRDQDELVVAYRYREALYRFHGYLDDFGRYHDLDLCPAPGHTYDGGRSTQELVNLPIYVYLLPTAAYRTKKADGTYEQTRTIYSGQRFTKDFLRWERTERAPGETTGGGGDGVTDPCRARNTFGHCYFGNATFVDALPNAAGGTNTGSAGSSGIAASGLAGFPSALILAKVYVTPNAQVGNVELIDSRVRGGGLPESVDPLDPALPGATRREGQTYWDVGGWDGQPVPLAGVLLVEIPGDVLTGANGRVQYSQDEVEQIVHAHVAAGVKVIVRYV